MAPARAALSTALSTTLFTALCALPLVLVGCDDEAAADDAGASLDAAIIVDAEADMMLTLLDGAPLAGDEGLPQLDAEVDDPDAVPTPVPMGDVVIVDGPEDAPERFAAAPEGECADPPVVIYPEANTALPRNIEGVDFQWDPGRRQGDLLFEVVMQTADASVRWYTAADHLVPAEAPWTLLKEAAARTDDGLLEVTVREYRGPDQPVCEATVLPLEIDEGQLKGAVYYFDTGMGGIARLPVNDREAERFLTPDRVPGAFCYGCHAVSRDGTRMAYTRSFGFPAGNLEAVAIDAPSVPFYPGGERIGVFPSFAPDGIQLVATSGGRLQLSSAETGALLDALPGNGPPDGEDPVDPLPSHPDLPAAGAPDWSWQGEHIVGVIGGFAVPVAEQIPLGSIGKWTMDRGAWPTPPELLVERTDDRSWDRPAFSPDGRWIAYNGVGDDPGNGGMDGERINPNLDLWLIDAEGAMPPIRLDRANMAELMGNSWPKWAPIQGAGRVWLAFTSLRAYGRVVPNDPLDQDTEPRPQIWVTGIDPLAEDGDPSAPAFWMPGQNTQGGNHAPYWAPYEKE